MKHSTALKVGTICIWSGTAMLAITMIVASCVPSRAEGAEPNFRQLTPAEITKYTSEPNYVYMGATPTRDNSDPDYQPPYKFNAFKPLSREAAYEELAWQGLNVVDMLQTIQIARNPECYEEVGTASMFVGSHPSKKEAIAVSVGFGVIHYLVTRAIDSLTDRNPDYKYLQRGWQIVSFVPKAAVVANNNRIGLGLTSSKSCVQPPRKPALPREAYR